MKVFAVVHNTGSEGIEVSVFGGRTAKTKAWKHVGDLIRDYISNRSKLTAPTAKKVMRAVEAGKFELAHSEWTVGQDEDYGPSYWDQESIDVEEKEVQ